MLFFKQKTAYEMRISDWSSDVCSSDLMNTKLGNILEAMNQGQLSTATGLVGKYALTSGTTAVQDSTGAVYGQIDIPEGSTDTSVAIKDSTGKTLRTISVGAMEAGKHDRSEEHTSELQSLMRTSYAAFCLK